MATNQLIDSNNQHKAIHEAVKKLAKVAGCDTSNEGGKEFARIMVPAISVATYEGGDIFKGIADKLLTFRPRKSH